MKTAAVLGAAFMISAAFAPMANAEPVKSSDSNQAVDSYDPLAPIDEDSPLDPSTFAGPMIVTTPTGNVFVEVEAGEAEQTIIDVRVAAAEGEMYASGQEATDAIMGACGSWITSFAGPGYYAESIDGCAVAGHNGFNLGYQWANQSSVQVCAQVRANNTSGRYWYGIGCRTGAGTSATFYVPWGNVLDYAKMRANSTNGISTPAYKWIT